MVQLAAILTTTGQRESHPQLNPELMTPLGLGECPLLVDAGLGFLEPVEVELPSQEVRVG